MAEIKERHNLRSCKGNITESVNVVYGIDAEQQKYLKAELTDYLAF